MTLRSHTKVEQTVISLTVIAAGLMLSGGAWLSLHHQPIGVFFSGAAVGLLCGLVIYGVFIK